MNKLLYVDILIIVFKVVLYPTPVHLYVRFREAALMVSGHLSQNHQGIF